MTPNTLLGGRDLDPSLLPRRNGLYRAEVDPKQIIYLRRSVDWPYYVKNCRFAVCGGDWDQAAVVRAPFREEQMRQLFVERLPFRETRIYQAMRDQLITHGRTKFPHCTSEAEITAYFERLERLFLSIKTDGYTRRKPADANAGEITVRVGRDGSAIKCGQGTHRLAIVRVLGLPSVPVVVDLMHTEWVLSRMQATGLPVRAAVEQGLLQLSGKHLAT
jgi:hypothetical protein